MKKVVLLDLDDTLVKGQSQKLFLKYLFAQKLINWRYFIKIYWWFILYKIGAVKDPRVIMEYAYVFVKGKTVKDIEVLSNDFFEKSLKKHIYTDAIELIKEHKKQGHVLVIVSNAAECIVKPAARFLKVAHFIGTPLEVVESVYTGKLVGNNVYGKYKIAYIQKFIDAHGLNLIDSFAYSDHVSDIPMLTLTDNPVAVNPDVKLAKEAQKRQWKILKFKQILN